MNAKTIRTILLAIVLAIFVVPFGGAYTVPGLLFIAGLALFDIYRETQRRERAQASAEVERTERLARIHTVYPEAAIEAGDVDPEAQARIDERVAKIAGRS